MAVIAIPEMRKRGYPDWLSGGLVATAGGIAMLIPPSIILLVYGIVTETSIVRLFFAGVIPGLLLALGNALSVVLIALYLKLPRSKFQGGAHIWMEFKGAAPALGMPVVILGATGPVDARRRSGVLPRAIRCASTAGWVARPDQLVHHPEHLDLADRLTRQHPQRLCLALVELSRLVIDHAE